MRIHTDVRPAATIGSRAFTILAAFVSVALLTSCGGGGTPPPPPQNPDFSISASTSSVSAQVGTTTAPVTVSVTALNGFSGSVSVSVSGLPAGITSSPAFPLNINANSSAQVTFTIPANASTGNFAVTVQATSASLSHSWPLTLTLTAPPTIISFAANPTTIEAGTSSNVTAVFAGGTGVITPGNLAVTSGTPVSVSPSTTTTYTLTVTPPVGSAITQTTTVTVSPAPTISSFGANPAAIEAGTSSSLTAVFSGGTGVITPGNLSVTSGTPGSVSPNATTTYTLTVTPPAGAAITQTATVIVSPAPTISIFGASPATISAGGSSGLTAVFANGTGVITPGNLAVTSGTAVSVSPTTTTTYTLTVTPPLGTAITRTATVTVVPLPTITSFAASPSTIAAGGSSSLTAVFANGTGVVTPGNLAVTSGTAVSVSPTTTTTYTVTVTPPTGTAITQTATVTVVPLPTITSFVANPATIAAGGSSSLTAVFANGTGVVTPGNLAVTSGTAVSVSPTTTTTYTVTVTPPTGTAITRTATVTVVPLPTITNFVASPATIAPGASSSLTAVFANGTGVITPGNLAVTSGTGVSVSPTTTTTYTVTVTPPTGTAITQTVTVTVTVTPDFSISASPSSVSTQMGTTSAPVTVSVTGLDGFTGAVSVAVSGLPAGTVCSPSCPLNINANSSAQVAFVVPADASTGSITFTVQGTSGNLNHSSSVTLGVTSSLQGYWNLWTGSAVPQGNPAPVSGLLFVSGWGFEGIPLNAVTVLVDNVAVGNGFYGLSRPDVASGIPGAPEDCGFSLGVDTTKLSNGLHTVAVNVTDSANNVTPMENFPDGPLTAIQINVNNPAPEAAGPVANLTLNAPTTSLVVGTIVGFTAQATDGSNNPVSPSFTWASTNTSIVQVTPTGAVLPLAAGNAKISVTAGGQTQQIAVTVQPGSGAPGSIQVSLGPEEVVFQYKGDACMEGDVPDGGARAVRLSDGSILLIAGDGPFNFADVGPDFWSLKRRCAPTLVQSDSPVANTFQNAEWIYSLYSDGTTIHALVHNEFHDPIAATCKPGDTTDANPCEYVSITYASSTDGGHTFQMLSAPQNVVAPPPVQWTPPAPGSPPLFFGYQEPTNIVHAADGFYYARFVGFTPPGQTYAGLSCVMRTQTIADPSSWRAWDGTAFELQMTDPYTGPSASVCTSSNVNVPWESLTFNTYLNMYMVVGLDSDFGANGPTNCGFHFSLSSDLVNWSTQQLIAPAYVPAPSQCQQPGAGGLAGSFAYGSIIDPADPSTNFETPGRTPYIYFTRFNNNSEDRDLVRMPVLITQY